MFHRPSVWLPRRVWVETSYLARILGLQSLHLKKAHPPTLPFPHESHDVTCSKDALFLPHVVLHNPDVRTHAL